MPVTKTLSFLPAIFRSDANQKFLNATLDQLVTEPNLQPINGFVGRKFSPGFTGIDTYVKEPSELRADYQLEPSVIVKDPVTNDVEFHVTYPEVLQTLNYFGSNVANPNNMWSSEYYNYNPHINYDAFINFGQYYWLPNGPDPVDVFANTVDLERTFYVYPNNGAQVYNISGFGLINNPELVLARGGTYTFNIDQPGKPFWVQTDPGINGKQLVNINLSSRQVLGVSNNGTEFGPVTFTVPEKTDQNFYIDLPLQTNIDLVTTLSYAQINNMLLSEIIANYGGIDGQTDNLDGKTFIFGQYYASDADWTSDGYLLPVNERTNICQIVLTPTGTGDYIFTVDTFAAAFPVNTKVHATTGINYGNTDWYKDITKTINPVPIITATLDVLYYQDGVNPNQVGMIRLVEVNNNEIDVDTDILGKQNYISPNGITFTNGLKIQFDSSVTPAEYRNNQYYVDGVGSAITLTLVSDLTVNFSSIETNYNPVVYFVETANASLSSTKDQLTITTDNNVTASNIAYGQFPNDNNPYYITSQDKNYSYPYRAGQDTQGDHTSIVYKTDALGVTYTGVPINGVNNGWYIPGTGGTKWYYDTNQIKVNGQDEYGGYADEQGFYIYRDSTFITANAWANVTGFTDGMLSSSGHSKIIGFAKDGYPIYGPWGYADPTDANSSIVRMGSSYTVSSNAVGRPGSQTVTVVGNVLTGNTITVSSTFGLNPGMRITTNDASIGSGNLWIINNGLNTAVGPSEYIYGTNQITLNANVESELGANGILTGSSLTFEFLPGAFIEDYTYDPGSSYLDQFNGRFCVTPEFPNGTYAYFASQDSGDESIYPYFIGRAFYGSVEIDTNTSLTTPDYIIINRSSRDLNPWTRRNRWFHKDVIASTAIYNNTVAVLDQDYRAKRPIIEFNPNFQLFDFGKNGLTPVDLFDTTTTQPFLTIEGSLSAEVDGIYVVDGMRVIFSADQDADTRGKIWVVNFVNETTTDPNDPKVIHLSLASDGNVAALDTVSVKNGISNINKSYYYTGTIWDQGQTKDSLNQAPLFDVFNSADISFGDTTLYPKTSSTQSFNGCKIFSYKEGTGTADTILGFPLSYKNFNNVGDIQFENNFDTDTFVYTIDRVDYTENVNKGFLHYNNADNTVTKYNVWTTAIQNSRQYQDLSYIYDGIDNVFLLDIVPETNTTLPNLNVYVNFKKLDPNKYQLVSLPSNKIQLIINPTSLKDKDKVDVLIYSSQVSKLGYFQIPDNLNYNAQNADLVAPTLGEMRNHIGQLTENSLSFTGTYPGPSNLRDLNVSAQGGTILQQSSPTTYASMFLTSDRYNFADSLYYAQQEYTKFKNKFLSLSTTVNLPNYANLVDVVDEIIKKINLVKNSSFPWFYSGMVPYGDSKNVITYTIFDPSQRNYEITSIYDPAQLNNKAILVYLNGTQLLYGQDYSFLTTSPGITISSDVDLNISDVLVINEYTNTDGNWIPETPSKLGIYPKFTPVIYTDYTYKTPTQMLRGHDGSLTPTFGDFRDTLLLELEKRIYNNIKVAYDPNLYNIYDSKPGKFRDTGFSITDFNRLVSKSYLRWIGTNKLNYTQNTTYESGDAFSFNYGNNAAYDVVDQESLTGSWRSCFEYFYDTQRPNTNPWEMLGFSEKPDWWEGRYGPAPYTAGNQILWDDLEAGYIAQGPRTGYDSRFARPGLSSFIPVDNNGTLLPPIGLLTQKYNRDKFDSNWLTGQWSPTETAWRNSSEYPYAAMMVAAVINPARFFALGIAPQKYRYNTELGQYLVTDTNFRLTPDDVDLNGYVNTDGTVDRSVGYLNWIVDYTTSLGVLNKDDLLNFVRNYSIQLSYRMAGFSGKQYLKVLATQNSPNSQNDSIIIPDSDFDIVLGKSTPTGNPRYSAVIIDKTADGFSVSGYDTDHPYFTVVPPELAGSSDTLTIGNLSAKFYTEFKTFSLNIPYGTTFATVQEVVGFLSSYQRWLVAQGFRFNYYDSDLGDIRNWQLSAKEFLLWVQQGWSVGNLLVLGPFANRLEFINPRSVVDEISNTFNGTKVTTQNFVTLDNDAYSVVRDNNAFSLMIDANNGDMIGLADLNLVQYEHVAIFNNTTQFNDIIYDPSTGERQYRLKLVGKRTGGWTGTLSAQGFMYNAPGVQLWVSNTDYLKGDLIEYKNFYYAASRDLPGTPEFNFPDWLPVDKNKIKTGLLNNFATNAGLGASFYEVDNINLENKFDTFSLGLIGYRNRDYLNDLGLDDTTQVKFYQGFIKEKGTLNAINAMGRVAFNGQLSNVSIREQWGFRVGTYGSLETNQYVETIVNEDYALNNPVSIQTYGNLAVTYGSLYNYNNGVYKTANPNWQPPFLLNRTTDSYRADDIQTAGYVNVDDVDYTVFDLSDTSTLSTQVENLGVGKIIWTAVDFARDWNVYRIDRTPAAVTRINNALNSKILITTNVFHNLVENDVVVINTGDVFSGIYRIEQVISLTSFVVQVADLPKSFSQRDYLSSTLNKLTSLRVNYATEIVDNNPIGGWTANSKVWVDLNDSTGWAVYNKSEPWLPFDGLQKNVITQNGEYGTSVDLSYNRNFAVIGEPGAGSTGSITNYKVGPNGQLSEDVTVTSVVPDTERMGSSVVSGKELLVVGAPNSDSDVGYVFVYNRDFQGSITQIQVLAPPAISGSELFGTSLAISNDDQWLYVGAPDSTSVYAYAYDDFVEEGVQTFTANGTGVNFTITAYTPDSAEFILATDSLGQQLIASVHFTLAGSTITFNNPPAAGTLIIRQTKGFRLITTLETSGSADEFGYSIACATDGAQVIIGAPSADITDGIKTYASAGYIEIYDRTIENYITQTGQTSFTLTRPIGQINKVYVDGVLQTYGVNYTVTAAGYWINFQAGYYPTAGTILQVETNEFYLIEQNVANTPKAGAKFGYSVDMCPNNCSIYVGAPYESSLDFYSGAVYRFLNQGRIYGTILGTVNNPTVALGDSIRINDFEVTFPTNTSLSYVISRINAANIPGISAASINGYLQINSTIQVNTNKLSILPGVGDALSDLGFDVYVETQKIENPTNHAYDYFGETVKINNNSNVLVVGSSRAVTTQATTFDITTGYETTFDGGSTTYHDDTPSGAVWVLSYLSDSRNYINYPGTFAFVQQLTMNSMTGVDLLPYTNFGQAIDIVDNELLVSAPLDNSRTTGGGAVYQFNNADSLLGWDVYRSEEPTVDIGCILKGYLYSASNQTIIDNLDYIDPVKGKILGVAEQEITYRTDYDPATYNNATIDTVASSKTFHWNDTQIGQVWWDLSAIKYLDYEQGSIKYRTTNWARAFPGSSVDVYEWVESLYPPSRYVANGGSGIPKHVDNSAYATKIYVDPATNVSTILYYFWVKDKDTVTVNQFGRQIPTTTIADYIRNPKNSGIKFFAAIRDDSISLYNVIGNLTGTDVIYHLDYATKLNSNIIHSEYALISEGDTTADVIPQNIYNKLVDSLSGSDVFGNPVPDVKLPVQSRYGIDIRPRQSMFIDNKAAIEQMVDFVNSVFAKTVISQGYDLSGLTNGEPYPPGAPTTIAWTPNTYYTKDQIISYGYTAYIAVNNFTSGTIFRQGLDLVEYFYYDLSVANLEELGYINVDLLSAGYKVLVESDSTVNGLWTVYTLQTDSAWLITQVESYNTSDYWSYADWYAEGFDNTVRPDYTISTIADIVNLPLKNSDIVKVLNNGQGKWTLVQVFPNTVVTIGIQDGTIQLSTNLYSGYGFDVNNFDSDRFDQSPSIEIRKILDALQNDIFINQLSQEFISLFFVFVYYVLDEQKYIDWAFKTSFIDIVQKVAGLDQPQLYTKDNQDYYRQYIEEVKPYHTTIKEYIIDYEGVDNFNGYVTDFDVPAYFDPVLQIYRSPSGELAEDIRALQQPQYRDWLLNYTYVIDSIDIVDGGSGYTIAPIVTITGSTIGNDAVAKAYVADGKITRIDVLYSGTNYVTQPVITFDGGSTTTARAYARLTNGKVRSVMTTLVYDRITYGTQVTDWTANTTYAQGSLLAYNGTAYVVNTTFTSGNSFVGSNLTVYPAYKLSSANDRIQAYYSPEIGLPGKDFALLQSGIDYPGVQVDGLGFAETTLLDATIESYYTDTELGTRPEDIIIDGAGYVDPYSSHAPEELIPGRTFDTLNMTVTTFATDCTSSSYADWVSADAFYVSDILILDGGAGYSNLDVNITISGGGAHTNATVGNIILDANGTIIGATVISEGVGYTSFPVVAITGGNSSVASASVRLSPTNAPSSSEPYPTFSYRIVKTLNTLYINPLDASGDSNVTYSFYRIDANSTTTLSSNLGLTDTEINVTDASVLFDPQPSQNIPGVIYINGERITYYQRFTANNTLGQIRRGTGGTGAIEHIANSNAVDSSVYQVVPLSAPIAKSFSVNTTDITTSGRTYTFLVGNTYVQSNLWLEQGYTGQDIVEEYVGNVNVNVIITEDSISITTDDDTYPAPADGRGLFNSDKIQAIFVKG